MHEHDATALAARIPALCAVLVDARGALRRPRSAADADVVSELRGAQPAVSGLELEVAGGDRFLLLRTRPASR